MATRNRTNAMANRGMATRDGKSRAGTRAKTPGVAKRVIRAIRNNPKKTIAAAAALGVGVGAAYVLIKRRAKAKAKRTSEA